MKTSSVIILSKALCLLLLFTGCSESKPQEQQRESRVERLPFYGDATFTPHWFGAESELLEGFHQIPPFRLINQEGDTLTEQDFAGKIYVTDFFFTSCPGICPKMTKNMIQLQKAFMSDPGVLLLSHSVTPERDSVSALKHYADSKGIKSQKWHLVTGDRDQIYDLGRNQYFVEEDLGLTKKETDFLHTENFVLIDKDRHIRGIYNGLNQTAIDQLIADVKTLKKESTAQ